MVWMPGESYRQALPTLTAAELKFQDRLKSDVETLAIKIGRRNFDSYQNLVAAKDFLSTELTQAGYKIQEQKYTYVMKSESFVIPPPIADNLSIKVAIALKLPLPKEAQDALRNAGLPVGEATQARPTGAKPPVKR